MKTPLFVAILFFLLPFTLESFEPIVMLENIDPLEWKYVRIHDDAIDRLAHNMLNLPPLQIADWRDLLPPGLESKECVDYIMGLICIDFCHWDLDGKEMRHFYTREGLRGSAAMSALAKEAYLKGIKIFEAAYSRFSRKLHKLDARFCSRTSCSISLTDLKLASISVLPPRAKSCVQFVQFSTESTISHDETICYRMRTSLN